MLAAIIVIYGGLSLYQLNLPGLHYDEAFEVVPAVQLLQGQPVTLFRNAGLLLGGVSLPLMTQDYIGALNTYMALPFIALMGTTPAALRMASVLVGAVALGLTFLLAVQLTNRPWVGLLATLLLAVDPTFVFWNRQGIFVTAITAPIGLAATCCWLRRWQGGLRRWSLAGGFLFGLGVYAKLLFIWLIAALVGAVILLNLKRLRQQPGWLLKQLSPTEIVLACLAFLLGCWPLIVYNLQTGGTWQNVAQNATTSYYGVNNLAVGVNLLERFQQFVTLLQGGHLWYLGDILPNWLTSVVFVVFLVLIVILSMRNQRVADAQIALFPFLVIGTTIVASVGTVSALWITHFALLAPWPALAVAIGSWYVLKQLPSQPRLKGVFKFGVLAVLAFMAITNLISTLRYHAALANSGGLSSHSDAVYDLSAWLAQRARGPVVAMDWGLAAPVTYLTGGQVTPIEIFGYGWQSDVKLSERLQGAIAQPDTLYLWRAPDEIIFDRSGEFKSLYRPLNLEENIEEAFYERSGRPILGVTRLVEKGTASNPPR